MSNDVIADIIGDKKHNPIVTELFIRGRKLNISPVFITQSYFKIPKDDELKSAHYFIVKISNKQELQQNTINYLSDIEFKGYMKLFQMYYIFIFCLSQ